MPNTPPAFSAQAALFKAYDIRGRADLFTADFVTALGHGFAEHYTQAYQAQINQGQYPTIVIGHDARLTSPAIAQHLAKILAAYDFHVLWLGLCTTPIMAHIAQQCDGAGIIATASHSPKDRAGLKWLSQHTSPTRDDIRALYCCLGTYLHKKIPPTAKAAPTKAVQATTAPTKPPLDKGVQEHLSHYLDNLHPITPHPLFDTVVVDCLHGAAGVIAQTALAPLSRRLITLNDTPDGNFPKGNPDPAEPERLRELSLAVVTHGADFGLAFDGDGDRLGVVDGTGALLGFDDLLYLLACASTHRSYASPQHSHDTSAKILFDVKCLHTLPALCQRSGMTPVMVKTGSSHLRAALQQTHADAVFAGELSGHFIFNDPIAKPSSQTHHVRHDDAMYAAVRLMHWLALQDTPLHDICARLPKPIATPDIYLPLSAALTEVLNPRDFVHALCQFYAKAQQQNPADNCPTANILDGLRLDFGNGFGLIRASNTSSSLTLRFAGDDEHALIHIAQFFTALIAKLQHPKLPPDAFTSFSEMLLAAIFDSVMIHKAATP